MEESLTHIVIESHEQEERICTVSPLQNNVHNTEKVLIPATGTRADEQRHSHLRDDNDQLWGAIAWARTWIFVQGRGVMGKWIQNILGTSSYLPNQVRLRSYHTSADQFMGNIQSAFSTRLSRHGFNFYSMFVVDLLHEFELGVWKAIFTHLLRVLYAEGQDKIQTMNARQVILN
jgi:hypothetical protein